MTGNTVTHLFIGILFLAFVCRMLFLIWRILPYCAAKVPGSKMEVGKGDVDNIMCKYLNVSWYYGHTL